MTESTEVATRDETSRAIVEAGDRPQVMSTGDMMAFAREMTLNKDVDANKLEVVMRIANEQQDRAREIEFYQDKNRAVRSMPMIRKDGRIIILDKQHPEDMSRARTQGHFEKWSDVQAAVTPVLDANFLTLTHKIDHADGQTIVIAVLTHDNGYREESGPMRLPLDTSGGKNNVQGAGSSQTYGMRYTARAICGLKLVGGQQDDDGNLTAMPDEPANHQQQVRLEEAERAYKRGSEAYEMWFMSIPPIDRKWMIETGRHAEFGGGRSLPGARNDDAPRPDQANEGPAGPDISTPEGWVEQYETDCAACESLDALTRLQDRGRKAMEKLRDGDHTELHERAVAAGSRAYARLSDGGEG